MSIRSDQLRLAVEASRAVKQIYDVALRLGDRDRMKQCEAIGGKLANLIGEIATEAPREEVMS